MAGRDYILCADCGCKLIYDGYDSVRDRLEMIWGDEGADHWTVDMICPECVGKLKASIACTGAPATLKPGCVVAMASALERVLMMQTRGYLVLGDEATEQARAALAMYNGGEQ